MINSIYFISYFQVSFSVSSFPLSFIESWVLLCTRYPDLGDLRDIASWMLAIMRTDPISNCPPPCPQALCNIMDPTENHREATLLQGRLALECRQAGVAPVNRNQVGGRACCRRCSYPVTLVGCDSSLHTVLDIPLTHLQSHKGGLDRC